MNKEFNLHDYLLSNLPKQLEVPDGYIRLSGPLERDNIVNFIRASKRGVIQAASRGEKFETD